MHELIIDPFESPFRPTQQIKTIDRTPVQANIASSPTNDTQQPDANVDSSKSDNKENQEVSLTPAILNANFPQSLKSLSQKYEVELIQSALEHCQYNQKKTAQALELTYHQLRGYLKKYNLLEGNPADE